jgi:hypothetical protein
MGESGMELHRLTPTSLSHAKIGHAGRCAACEQPVKQSETVVHIYGETFHHDCAFYRGGTGARRGRSDRAI